MQDSEFKYMEDGRKVYVREKMGERISRVSLVYTRAEDDDEEWVSDKTFIHEGELFEFPPCPSYHSCIAKLDLSIEAKTAELKSLSEQLSSKKTEIETFKKSIENKSHMFVGLETLASVMDLKITHFVVCQFEPRIASIEDAKVKEQTIMMLSFKKKREEFDPRFKWRVNTKGAYDFEDAIPCSSLEEANKVYAVELGKYMIRTTLCIEMVRKCNAAGVVIPAEKIQDLRNRKVKGMETLMTNVAENKARMALAEAEMKELDLIAESANVGN